MGFTSASRQNVDMKRTSQEIAEERGVTDRTIQRDGVFAAAIDTLKENVSPQFAKDILSGKTKTNRKLYWVKMSQ